MKRKYSFVIVLCSFLFISINTHAQTSFKDLTAQVNEITDPLGKVMSLQPVIYRYNTDKFKNIRLPKGDQYGFDIETANAALPELISDRKYSYAIGKNTYRTATVQQFNADNLIPFLVGAIQQQQSEIDKLKAELALLKKEITNKE